MSVTFWPGYRWRLLACRTTGYGVSNRTNHVYTDEQMNVQHHEGDLMEFDELVIDHWLHLEQMDARDWHLRVGDRELNIHIDGRRRVTVVDSEEV